MKKNLLIAIAVALTVSVTAQHRLLNPAKREAAPDKIKEMLQPATSEQSGTSVFPKALLNHNRRTAPGVNGVLSNTATIDTLGQSNNFSAARFANRTQLWYDQDVNSLTFIHRVLPTVTGDSSFNAFRYDVSKDGANTWANNQGPVFIDNGQNYRARDPQAVIANPTSGNTVADNAYIAYDGTNYAATSGYYFRGRLWGVQKLDTTGTTQNVDTITPYVLFADDIFTIKSGNHQGEIWKVGDMYVNDLVAHDFNYMDSIVITHGIWNTTTNDYDFTNTPMYFPVRDTVTFRGPTDINIAFDDNGQVGYIAAILNNDFGGLIYPDSVLYLSVIRTTDGGQTWDYPSGCSPRPDIIDVSSVVDPLLANDPTITYAPGFDMDIVVDVNSNLHIATVIAVSQNYAVFTGDSLFGMFDVYTNDLGVTWKAKKLAAPVAFRGIFGDGSTEVTGEIHTSSPQDSRPFASRNWAGTKLFFSWFDTDTVIHGPSPDGDGRNNWSPDLWSIGYDVTTDLWTAPMNLTQNTDADGACTFGSGSYYVIDSANTGTVFSIPTVYMQLEARVHTGFPVQFWYIKNANVTFPATIAGNAVTLPCAPDFVQQTRPHEFSVSSNYPNPFNGKTSFDINLINASDVTVEVSNLLGEVLSMNKYPNLDSGFHTLTIDGNKLSPGIYFYQVKAGNDAVTRKMTIQ